MDSFFFQDKLEQSFNRVTWWCNFIEENEDKLNLKIIQILSHVINMDHIWIYRLKHLQPDSGSYDVHQAYHLKQLNEASKREWLDFWFNNLVDSSLPEAENQTSSNFSLNISFNLLMHHAKHLGQITMLCKELGLVVDEPSLQVIE